MIQIEKLSKSYPQPNGNQGRLTVLDDFSLDVAPSELVTFFGPNGCGKSTLLKVLAGVEPYDSGTLHVAGKSPEEAETGLIFQNYSSSLYPWLTAKQNMLFAFSLEERKHLKKTAGERLDHLIDDLGLRSMLPLQNYPYQLSGGQQQLVAILRTLLYDPKLILMDEPFSSLDYQTRALMQATLQDIWHQTKATILFVSHDIEEAILLGDRVILLTPMPARVYEVIDLRSGGVLSNGTVIDSAAFARPRGLDLLESEAFFRVKKNCRRVMREQNR
jgi:NitT/TauT family transport system ATP-binding protein